MIRYAVMALKSAVPKKRYRVLCFLEAFHMSRFTFCRVF